MKILVTGGAGFIGSHLAESLSDQGHHVTVVDSLSDFLYPAVDKLENIESFSRKRIEFKKLDLVFDDLNEIVVDKEVIINLAAIPGLVKSWSHIDAYMSANVLGLGRLLEASKKINIKRFIQISTSSVYGKNANGNELAAKEPYSPYGVSKLAAENLVRAYEANFDLPIVILRYFSVYGPRQRPDMAYQKFINSINSGVPFKVFGTGKQLRSNTYVDDIVDATILATNLDLDIDGHVFNVAGQEDIELLNAISLIEKIIGKKAKFSFEEKRDGDQYVTRGDFTSAQLSLGYHPRTSFEVGISRQIEWNLTRNNADRE
jgi:nucleoside-diphosphate-sugar epimerase